MADALLASHTLVTLTADIVAAHVSKNNVAVSDLPLLINNVFGALSGLGGAVAVALPKQEPAVSVRSSIKPDYIVCLEDGKKLKMLKRHLMTHYQMTLDEYRAKWGLSADYLQTPAEMTRASQRAGLIYTNIATHFLREPTKWRT